MPRDEVARCHHSGNSEHIPQILPANKALENPPPYRESADTANVI